MLEGVRGGREVLEVGGDERGGGGMVIGEGKLCHAWGA